MDRRLGGSHNRSGRGGEEKNSQLLPELDTPIIQPVAQRYTTELSQLLYSLDNGKSKSKKGVGFAKDYESTALTIGLYVYCPQAENARPY
jgi:hypothetical protein